MDLATLIGLCVSIGVVAYAVAMGGNFGAFLDVPSILIVGVGTVFITMVSFNFKELGHALAAIGGTFALRETALEKEAIRLVELAQKARKEGILNIQNEVPRQTDPFFRQGLALVVDSAPADLIEKLLYADTATMLERHATALAVLRRAAEISPAMGLIGTLIGLVQMLGQLSEPDKIGPAMAIAILTTFYGAIMAYMVFLPLAGKLERNGGADLLLRKLHTAAVMSIVKQENPRQLELTLNALLPPAHRIRVFK